MPRQVLRGANQTGFEGDFDPVAYWSRKPYCEVCGERKVKRGTICHECLANASNARLVDRRLAVLGEARRSVEAIKAFAKTYGRTLGLWERIGGWLAYPLERAAFDEGRVAFEQLVREKCMGFPWLARAWADYHALTAELAALSLVTKGRPAAQAATEVREARAGLAEAVRRARVAEYLLAYYESLFPWLVDLRGEDIDELLVTRPSDEVEGEGEPADPARKWLTGAEYERLAPAEKHQLALDRYWQKKKTRWEVGRDYERYIGYKYETAGFAVYYQGIIEGFEDLGRDLIAAKDKDVEVVQCKYWSGHKTIHEKHVFQLFGTVTAYRLDNPGKKVTGAFITSTRLSDRARQFAEALDVNVQEKLPLQRYPCVKCNVSRRDGTKIYHLPFDQQYDRTIIEEERLERYVETVAEAERLGFRRARRWLGPGQESAGSAPKRRRRAAVRPKGR